MNQSDVRNLRRLAREVGLSPAALNDAMECGLFVEGESAAAWMRGLRQMRRMMNDLGVNAAGAALLVRTVREMESMQRKLQRLNRLEARWFEDWDEGHWRDLLG